MIMLRKGDVADRIYPDEQSCFDKRGERGSGEEESRIKAREREREKASRKEEQEEDKKSHKNSNKRGKQKKTLLKLSFVWLKNSDE